MAQSHDSSPATRDKKACDGSPSCAASLSASAFVPPRLGGARGRRLAAEPAPTTKKLERAAQALSCGGRKFRSRPLPPRPTRARAVRGRPPPPACVAGARRRRRRPFRRRRPCRRRRPGQDRRRPPPPRRPLTPPAAPPRPRPRRPRRSFPAAAGRAGRARAAPAGPDAVLRGMESRIPGGESEIRDVGGGWWQKRDA